MSERPASSPWGKIQHCNKKHPGVFEVSTAGHGGIMVNEKAAAELLSPAAVNCGFKERGFICFEEDTQTAVVIKEMLDKNLWKIPEHFKDGKEKYAEIINDSVARWNPEYLDAVKKPSILADMERKQKEIKPPARKTAAQKSKTEIGE